MTFGRIAKNVRESNGAMHAYLTDSVVDKGSAPGTSAERDSSFLSDFVKYFFVSKYGSIANSAKKGRGSRRQNTDSVRV